jgi:hypothetical protein
VGKTSTPADTDYIFDPVLSGNVYSEGYTMTYANEWTGWQAGKTVGGVWGTVTSGTWAAVTPSATNSDEFLRGSRIESNSAVMKADGTKTAAANLNEWYAYSGVAGQAIIKNAATPVYVYENKPGLKQETAEAAAYEGFDADDVVAIILEGTLTARYSADGVAPSSDQTKTRYWRVNIRLQDAYHITRNAVYTTTVDKILTPGYATPWEAEESEEVIGKPGDTISEFIISVNKWDIKPVGNGGI